MEETIGGTGESLSEYLGDENVVIGKLHCISEQSGEFNLSAESDLLKNLKKNGVGNIFMVVEPDCMSNGKEADEPFVHLTCMN